jgi:hypothetical protein
MLHKYKCKHLQQLTHADTAAKLMAAYRRFQQKLATATTTHDY